MVSGPWSVRPFTSFMPAIINLPVDEGIVYNLTQTSGVREKGAAWSPDGKHVVYLSDKTGEEEFYLSCPIGDGEPKQLTKDGHAWRERPLWSPDSSKILFHDKFMRLNMVDAAGFMISGNGTRTDFATDPGISKTDSNA